MLTPLDYVLPHVGNSTVLRYAGALIVVLFLLRLIKVNGLSVVVSSEQAIILWLILLYAISVIWAQYSSVAMSYMISFGSTAFMYCLLIMYTFTLHQVRVFESSLIIGGVILVWYVFTKVNLSLVFAGYRLDFDNIGSENFSDPNGLAARIMMPLVFTIKRLLERGKWWRKPIYAAAAVALVYLLFLTGSRGAIVALVAIGSCITMSHAYQRHTRILLLIVTFVVIVLLYLPEILPEHIYARIFTPEQYGAVFTTSGDRIDIWRNALSHQFLRSPLLGYGAGNSSYAMIDTYGHVKAIHNSYLQCLIDTGLLGFIPWATLLVRYVAYAISLHKKDSYVLAVLVSSVIMAFMLDSIMEKYLWNSYLYVYMVECVTRNRTERFGGRNHNGSI
jgi:O-antigen ligase